MIDFEDKINEFLNEVDIAPISKRQYKSNLKLYYLWVNKQGVYHYELRPADAIKYKQELIKKGHTPLTVANYMVTISLFYRWFEKSGYGKNITTSVRINKQYKEFRKKSLSVDQAKHFLKQFETETLSGKRNYAIANLMLRNGLREIEVVRMNVEDIQDRDNSWIINIQRKGKHSKDTSLPLSDKAMEAIEQYLQARNDEWQEHSPLFVSLSNNSHNKRVSTSFISTMIKSKLIASGLTGKMFTAHSLRHTTATLLLADGYSEYEVMLFMGHSNFNTTRIYSRQKEMEIIFNNKPTKYFDKAI